MEIGIRLFGALEVTTRSRTTGVRGFPSRKAKILCELLALAGGHPVPRGRLIEELWGDKLPRDPNAALDHTVSLLRAVLRGDDGTQPLVHAAGMYRIDTTIADVDVVRFDRLARRATVETGAIALNTLLEAIEIADGELLADEPYAPWAAAARDRYAQRVESMLIDIARRSLALDDPELARRMSERARTESAAVVEQAYALNVSALIALGRRDEARRLIGELQYRLRVDHDSDVSDDIKRLRSILRDPSQIRRRRGGTIAVATRPREPIGEVSFIGRDHEIARIEHGLAEARLGRPIAPTIVEGPGGIGTSRLIELVGERFEGAVHRLTCLAGDRDHDFLAATRLAVSLTPEPLVVADFSAPSLFARIAKIQRAGQPALLLIDHIHLADRASLAVIASVAQNGTPVLASRRRDGVHEPVESDERVIRLGPLQRHHIESLPLVGAWHETGGHPGLLGICLDAHRRQDGLVRDGVDCRHGGGHRRVGDRPPDEGGSGDGVTGRVDEGRLDDDSIRTILRWVGPDGSLRRDVLAMAATLHPCSIDRLAGALGLSSTMTAVAIEHAADLGLVNIEVDATVTFRADLVRRVLQASAMS